MQKLRWLFLFTYPLLSVIISTLMGLLFFWWNDWKVEGWLGVLIALCYMVILTFFAVASGAIHMFASGVLLAAAKIINVQHQLLALAIMLASQLVFYYLIYCEIDWDAKHPIRDNAEFSFFFGTLAIILFAIYLLQDKAKDKNS